ncbi:MAG TPA: MarR family winged helix-turn-helix transcriptional regulator [Acidimicrobiales bacterium]|nr:MarR family winged helix-turn-helix transcriptional regulator [Acidimicrobiales bacterium]
MRATPANDLLVLARLIVETAALMRRAVVPCIERDHGLPTQSLDVLVRLAQADGHRLRMSDLAAQSLLTPSGLTRAVDRLCEAGLVDRHNCPHDRRVSFASLTAEGTARVATAMACHRTALRQLLGEALDLSEQKTMALLLLRLRDRLVAAGAAAPEV